MIHLLFAIVLGEMAMVLALLFKSPLRELVMMGLDQMKRGKGPVVSKTVALTILVVFVETLHDVRDVQKHFSESGVVNPTDEVLMANGLLEASLLGFILFLALVTDRLHNYISKRSI
ncbi:hypothetical protein SLE2022_397160 [Rubroshorea leprosula]